MSEIQWVAVVLLAVVVIGAVAFAWRVVIRQFDPVGGDSWPKTIAVMVLSFALRGGRNAISEELLRVRGGYFFQQGPGTEEYAWVVAMWVGGIVLEALLIKWLYRIRFWGAIGASLMWGIVTSLLIFLATMMLLAATVTLVSLVVGIAAEPVLAIALLCALVFGLLGFPLASKMLARRLWRGAPVRPPLVAVGGRLSRAMQPAPGLAGLLSAWFLAPAALGVLLVALASEAPGIVEAGGVTVGLLTPIVILSALSSALSARSFIRETMARRGQEVRYARRFALVGTPLRQLHQRNAKRLRTVGLVALGAAGVLTVIVLVAIRGLT